MTNYLNLVMMHKPMSEWSLSDFCQLEIERSKGYARIITGYYDNNRRMPVHLPGFITTDTKTDFEVAEEAYDHFKRLYSQLRKDRRARQDKEKKKPTLWRKFLYYALLLLGRERAFFGFCPKCNSDAPELYMCEICAWGHVPKKKWINRYKKYLKEKYL